MELSRSSRLCVLTALAGTLISSLLLSARGPDSWVATFAMKAVSTGKLLSTDVALIATTSTSTTTTSTITMTNTSITSTTDSSMGLDLSPSTSTASNASWHWILVNCQMDARWPRANQDGVKSLICPRSRCFLKAFDENILMKAKAVVFNPLWPISRMPESKPAGQLWVYSFFFEAPDIHQGAKPRTARVASNIDLTMTFQQRSDIFRPHNDMLPLSSESPADWRADASFRKKYLLILVVSNCAVRSRMRLFKELQSRLGPDRVHLYGACGQKHPCDRFDMECNIKFFSQYKFYAAFENSRCEGYITEKFYRGFQTFMVPLAYGGMGRLDYERVAPKDSFLHVDDFDSVDDMAKVLKEIDHDDERYSRFHEWRKRLRVSHGTPWNGEVINRVYCEVCDRIDHPKGSRSRSNHDLHNWFFDTCTSNQPHWNSGNRSSRQHLP